MLTAGERKTVEGLAGAALDERLLRLWCAKEAAARYLGIGLLGQPEAFEVGFVAAACARAQGVVEGATTEVRCVRDGLDALGLWLWSLLDRGNSRKWPTVRPSRSGGIEQPVYPDTQTRHKHPQRLRMLHATPARSS